MPRNVHLKSKGFNPFDQLIGLGFSRLEDGYSQCVLEVNESLLNPNNVVHGGVIYSMADTSMGAALYTLLGEGETCATVEIKISYLKAAVSGTLTCDTKVIRKGGRIAFLESEVRNNEHLVAKATGTFSIFTVRR